MRRALGHMDPLLIDGIAAFVVFALMAGQFIGTRHLLAGQHPTTVLTWLLAVGISFVDGELVTFVTSLFVIGMAASFLLGSQRAAVQAQTGLAVAVGCAAVVVYDKPAHSVSELVFIPLLFGICWLAGFAVRERAEKRRRRRCARPRPSVSGMRPRGSRWRRSARESRANSTTSSPTPSA